MYLYFSKLFSKFKRGFCRGLSGMNCLITLLDIGKGLMTNLSKASNCIDHELLIVEVYL